MGKKFISTSKFTIFLLLSFLLSASFNISRTQEDLTQKPKLEIIKAELGIFDNKIKNEELVAFKNSPGIWRDNTYAAAYTNWLEQQDGDVWFNLSNPNFNNKHEVFKIEKAFPNPTQLKEKYEYAKKQYVGKYPDYKDEIVKQIFEKIKKGAFKGIISKEDLNSGVWEELPFDENDFASKIEDNASLSPFQKEQYKKTTFVHQYKIRNYELKEGDQIQLRVLSGSLMGLTHMYWGAIPLEGEWTWMPKLTDKSDATDTNWKIIKVNKDGKNIENLAKVCIESLCPGLEGRRIQRFGVIVNTERALIRPQSQEYPNWAFGIAPIKENAYFDIYRLGPETNRFDPTKCKPLDITSKFDLLMNNRAGLSQISDGITFPREDTGYDWKYFGDPLNDPSEMSNLWLQLKVTYKLGRKTYTHIFNEWEENIQIPTQEELNETGGGLKSSKDIEKRLTESGFVKEPESLVQISVAGKNTVGFNTDGNIYQFDSANKNWKLIASAPFIVPAAPLTQLRPKQIAIGYDGTILVLLDEKALPFTGGLGQSLNLYELKNGRLENPVIVPVQVTKGNQITSFSMSSKSNIWATGNNFALYQFNLPKQQFNTVTNNYKITSVSTSSDGTTLGLTSDGKIYRWIGGTNYRSTLGWDQISGPQLKQISVGSEKYIRGIDEAGKLYKWTGEEWVDETFTGDAKVSQIAITNIGEIWMLTEEAQAEFAGDYSIYYYAKNVWALNTDKFALHSKISKAGYLTNLTETPAETNLQAGIDENALWTAITSKDSNDIGPLTYGATIILKSSNNKYISADKDNNLIASSNMTQATEFTLINQPKPSSKDEVSKNSEAPVLFKADKKYLSVLNKQAMLVEKDVPGLSERWVIEED
jgi:hypothetical protein